MVTSISVPRALTIQRTFSIASQRVAPTSANYNLSGLLRPEVAFRTKQLPQHPLSLVPTAYRPGDRATLEASISQTQSLQEFCDEVLRPQRLPEPSAPGLR